MEMNKFNEISKVEQGKKINENFTILGEKIDLIKCEMIEKSEELSTPID